jgi:hypothetical protein
MQLLSNMVPTASGAPAAHGSGPDGMERARTDAMERASNDTFN